MAYDTAILGFVMAIFFDEDATTDPSTSFLRVKLSIPDNASTTSQSPDNTQESLSWYDI